MEPHSRLSALSMDMLTASLLEHTVRYDHETSLAETYDNFLANNAALQASGQLCRVMLRLVQEQHERRQAANFPEVAGISAELSAAPPRKRSRDDFQPNAQLSANIPSNQQPATAELMEVDFEPAENAAEGTLKRKIRKVSAQPTSVIVDARRRMGPLTPLNVDANEVVPKIGGKNEFPQASTEVHERRPLDPALHAGTLNSLAEHNVEVIRNGADIQLPPPQPRRHAAPLPRNWRLACGQSYSATTSPNRVSAGQKLRQRIANSATVQSFQRGLIEFAPGQVQRLRARIAAKEAQHDPNGAAASFDLIGQYQRLRNHHSPPTSRELYRRRRRTSVPLQPEADRVSPAHPDYHIGAFLDESMRPPKFDVLLRQAPPPRTVQEDNAWDSSQAGKSVNIYVRDDDKLTLHRHPVAQSTDCIRGKKGYSRGFHVWEILWPLRQRGTHAVIGVCDKNARMQVAGYSSLIGSDEHSYGWDIIHNHGLHMAKTKSHWTFPDPALVDSSFSAPEKIYCILDMDEGYMAFATEEKYLGVAFRNLKGKTLHPVVCAVWGHCEITMRYMGSLDPKPRSLMEICRRTIRLQLGPSSIDKADDLDLPNSLRDYVLFRPTAGSSLL